jgi:hypothetical protein
LATFTRVVLSGGSDGKAVKVVATATAGTTIHTAHSTSIDEVWLWAYNSHTADVLLTIEFGGATAPDNNIVVTIPKSNANPAPGLVAVVPGLCLTNSLTVKAFAATANVITLSGYVNRIAN